MLNNALRRVQSGIKRRACQLCGINKHDPSRNPRLKTSDTLLISYPRSGNTWIRAIIAYLLYSPEYVSSLQSLNQLVPDIHFDVPRHNYYSQPRVIKTHHRYKHLIDERYGPYTRELYRHGIYIVRNPIDVIASYYHYAYWGMPDSKRPTFKRFVELLTHDAIQPRNWEQHVLSWMVVREELDLRVIRFEDLKSNTVESIQQLGEWLGHPCTPEEAEDVRQKTSREAMIQLEQKGSLDSRSGFEFVRRTPEQSRMDIQWTDELKALVWEHNSYAMKQFGYEI